MDENIEIEGFAVEVKKVNGNVGELAGEMDIVLPKHIIEVKKSYNAFQRSNKEQLEKFFDNQEEFYMNPHNKKVILYIDELMRPDQIQAIQNTYLGNVQLFNSLDDLIKFLK